MTHHDIATRLERGEWPAIPLSLLGISEEGSGRFGGVADYVFSTVPAFRAASAKSR